MSALAVTQRKDGVARALDVRKSAISIATGATARRKLVDVTGIDTAYATERLGDAPI